MIRHILTLIWNKKGANALVLLEVLLSFLILFAVLSFVFYNMDRFKNPMGFETENRKYLIFGDLEEMDSLQRVETLVLLKRSLQEMDLVENVSLSHPVGPFAGSNWCHGNEDNGYEIQACYAVADEDYIKANGMKLVKGRDFTEEDITATYPPMIANQVFMDEFFPEQDMIDSILIFQGESRRLIGVVEAFKYNGEFEDEGNRMILLYRPQVDAGNIRLSRATLHLSPNADIAYEERISNIVESVTKSSSFRIQDAPLLRKRRNLETWIPIVALLSICGFLCLNVALGLFGVLSYSISKRKAEVGLRRALGAHAGSIISQFTMEIILLAGLAVLVGVVFAVQIPIFKVMDVNSSIFYRGITAAAFIILGVVTLCALYPSVQASRIHPATALHED